MHRSLGGEAQHAAPQRWLAVYGCNVRCFSDPGTIHATCEDYRAGASIDLVYDDADFGVNKVTCPLFALWSETGYVGRNYQVD